MAQGNRKLLSGIIAESAEGGGAGKLPPKTAVLQGRTNRLAELINGQTIARMHELVDPDRCRIWDGHNREYSLLDETSCADLIESFKAQGRQEVPAIVRRLRSHPDADFEIICGARRHWTASWMRRNGSPNFSFLVEPRELTDEEAFRVADLENRSRRDLSDIERARDYARAVDRYYDGDQRRMAQRLKVTDTWLSRFLDLARLPGVIIAAFGSGNVIGISHAAQIAPLVRSEATNGLVLQLAERLSAEQNERQARGEKYLSPSAVVQALSAARAQSGSRRRILKQHVVRGDDGRILATGKKTERGGGLTISLPSGNSYSAKALSKACDEILAALL